MLISLFEVYETGGPIVYAASDRRMLVSVNHHHFGLWMQDGHGFVQVAAVSHQLDFQEPFANVCHDAVEVYIAHIEERS